MKRMKWCQAPLCGWCSACPFSSLSFRNWGCFVLTAGLIMLDEEDDRCLLPFSIKSNHKMVLRKCGLDQRSLRYVQSFLWPLHPHTHPHIMWLFPPCHMTLGSKRSSIQHSFPKYKKKKKRSKKLFEVGHFLSERRTASIAAGQSKAKRSRPGRPLLFLYSVIQFLLQRLRSTHPLTRYPPPNPRVSGVTAPRLGEGGASSTSSSSRA